MIDLSSNLQAIEQLMSLMDKYKIDECSVDWLHLKRSKHTFEKAQLTPQELLQKHLQSEPAEPWESLPQDAVDAWAKGAK